MNGRVSGIKTIAHIRARINLTMHGRVIHYSFMQKQVSFIKSMIELRTCMP